MRRLPALFPALLLALAALALARPAGAALPPWIDDPEALFAPVRGVAGPALAPAELLALRREGLELAEAGEDRAAAQALARVVEQNPADAAAWSALAWARYRAGEFAAAATAFRRVVALGYQGRARGLYNVACCLARAGDRDGAFEALERSLAAGFESRPQLLEDEDLASLRGDPRLARLAGARDTAGLGRAEGWALDLDHLADEVARMHWTMRHGGDASAFRRGCEALAAQVPQLDDGGVALGIQRLMASLGDGHSVLYPVPTGRVPFPALPVQFHWFEDGLSLVATPSGEHVGRIVESIGGVPVDELQRRLAALVSRDNAMGLLWLGPLYLTGAHFLRDAGAWDGQGDVVLGLAGGGHYRVPPGANPSMHLHLPEPPGADAPLWLRRKAENYWVEWLEGPRLLYVQYNQVRNAPDEPLRAFARRLRDEIDRLQPAGLLLDLRHNNGGNSFLNRPMLASVLHYENTVEGGELFVAIGRNTYSAAQNFATELDYYTGATFVGEPSGSSPNMVGEDTRVELPWSGLRLSVSSRYHQTSHATDERPFIAPEMPVGLSVQQWLAGEDPLLDAVLATLSGGGASTAH